MKFAIAILILAGMQLITSAQLPLQQTTILPVSTHGSGAHVNGSCALQQQRDSARQRLKGVIANILRNHPIETVQCGAGQWTRVFFNSQNFCLFFITHYSQVQMMKY